MTTTPAVSLSPRSKLGAAIGVRDTDRQQMAIRLKLDGWTYAAIAKELGVTRQRVQQMVRPSQQTVDFVTARAGNKCERCSEAVRGHGHIHHVRPQDDYNAATNLLYLCPSCHRLEHTGPFTELSPADRKLAAEAFGARYLIELDQHYCMACGSPDAPQGLCDSCRNKHRAISAAKSRLSLWKRAATKTSRHSLLQAICEIRKHNLRPEDFQSRARRTA